MAEAFEAGKAYEAELDTLTVNSKPIINSLTMIAEDHLPFCTTIQGAFAYLEALKALQATNLKVTTLQEYRNS